MPPRPITGRRCAPISAIRNCWSTPSTPCSPTATSTRRRGSPIACSSRPQQPQSPTSCSASRPQAQAITRTPAAFAPVAVRGPVNDLTGTLLAAWSAFGANDAKGAVDTIDKLTGPGMVRHLQGHACRPDPRSRQQQEGRGKRLEHAYKLDSSALRIMQAYAGFLSRNGAREEARQDLRGVRQAVAALSAGRRGAWRSCARTSRCRACVNSPQAGAAEALYGLGAALGRREEELSLANRGLAYLQLALYLEPNHALALLALADLYEAMKKPELAIKVYERVPADSPLKRNAEIQLAIDLDSLERTDEAKKHLDKLVASKPGRSGGDPRARQYPARAQAIRRLRRRLRQGASTLQPNPTQANWTIFYFRGICFERDKQWPKAEADIKKALELYPDQPHVLNYLGYSWIDQGIHLDDGMSMIKRSVEQRPDDGYIVDSLGWAYYRHRQLRRGGEEPRARRRTEAGRPDHQRSSRRRLLEGRPHAGGQVPVVACARSQARTRRVDEDRDEAQGRAAARRSRRKPRSQQRRRQEASGDGG